MKEYDKPLLDKNNEPLKIGILAAHHCIRCIKISRALRSIGYTTFGLGNKIAYGSDGYETYHVYKSKQQFQNSVKMLIDSGCSILEYNTEPDFPVSWIREVVSAMGVQDKVKIIANLHDLDSIRRKENIIPIPERKMFNDADGFVHVSQPIQVITDELHAVTKPSICLYSYCNKNLVSYEDSKERTNALVYEGGVNSVKDDAINAMFPYRNLFPIFTQLIEQGNEVRAFLGDSISYQTGQNLGVIVYPPTPYDTMMKSLTKFKYGILIFNNKEDSEPQVRYALPNKFYEYAAAGLPSITCWCTESEKQVKKWGVGFVFSDITEIGDTTQLESEYKQKMENIKIFNSKVYMENFIWKLENLYAEVLSIEKKGIPIQIQELSEFEYGKKETETILN